MRDLMLLGALLVFVPLAMRHVFVAYLFWGWAGIATINSYMYGFMQQQPIVMLFALIALTLLFLGKDREARKFQPDRTTTLFVVFGLHGLVCAIFAYPGLPRNWELSTGLIKTLLFCGVMPMLLVNRLRIHAFIVMLCIALALHGVVDGLKFLATGGAHLARGIPKFGDNNHYALILVMGIPLLMYLSRQSANRMVRLGAIGAVVLFVLAVVATRSRGGLICMLAIAVWFIMTSKRRVAGIAGIVVCGALVVALAPEEWTHRMNSIANADEDSSFMGRVVVWRASSAIAIENPVFGGGIHAIESGSVWQDFRDKAGLLGFLTLPNLEGLGNRGRAAHSIYFEVLGDMGFIGLAIFLAILVNAFLSAAAARRIALTTVSSTEWAVSLIDMLRLALLAYMIGGAALSVAYFELPYSIIMLIEVIKRTLVEEQRLEVRDNDIKTAGSA